MGPTWLVELWLGLVALAGALALVSLVLVARESAAELRRRKG